MQPRILLLALLIGLSSTVGGQAIDLDNYRTYDGSHNNLANPDWGAAGSNVLLRTLIGYDDLISAPAGPNRPNPRVVSNTIFAQDGLINDQLALNDFCWIWGQFIDHDFGLTPDGNEDMPIPVPQGDQWFDPFNTGQMTIPAKRNLFDPNTGTSPQNPRRHPNIITAYIDGSGVYGSDEPTARWLRSFEGGKLKISAGNLPPYNTIDGERDSPIDLSAPHMDNPVGLTQKLFVCGDPRANENPALLSMHILFVREHNRLCEDLVKKHPEWDDEQLYQHARKLVGALIQSIHYDEWLPTVGIELPPYDGYKTNVHAQVFNVFTAAAFRLGHTLLNGQLLRVDNDGNTLPGGHLSLRDVFFNISSVEEHGIDPIFKGMGIQMQQNFDSKVVNDVRNFLFGPPGAGGLDLVSINIARGRERGLPDYNTVRMGFSLPRYQIFQQVNPDPQMFFALSGLYGSVNNLDPWVGFLVEPRVPGKLFGETLVRIMEVQFARLRDGDRFFYLNDPVLTEEEKEWVKRTTLRDIIMKNTGITLMQDNLFAATAHEEICDRMTAKISGRIYTETGLPVSDVAVSVMNNQGDPLLGLSDPDGGFRFDSVAACYVNMVMPLKDGPANNGITTADMLLISRHIIGTETLDSPYKIIAADVDRNGTISSLDLIHLRRVILGTAESFPNNTAWRFVKADYEFETDNPLAEDFPEWAAVEDVLSLDMDVDFIAVKVGDVNGDANPTGLAPAAVEYRSAVAFQLEDLELQAGQVYTLAFQAEDINRMSSYQFGLRYPVQSLEFLGAEPGALPQLSTDHFGIFAAEGLLTTAWANAGQAQVPAQAPLFYLNFRALRDGQLSQLLSLDNSKTSSKAYDHFMGPLGLSLDFRSDAPAGQPAFALYQNQPNPFQTATLIPFLLPQEGRARLTVFDAAGKALLIKEAHFGAGYNEWQLKRAELPASGLLSYRLDTDTDTATRRMIIVD
jgi:hypothetical protein